jgi:hypothetical protein
MITGIPLTLSLQDPSQRPFSLSFIVAHSFFKISSTVDGSLTAGSVSVLPALSPKNIPYLSEDDRTRIISCGRFPQPGLIAPVFSVICINEHKRNLSLTLNLKSHDPETSSLISSGFFAFFQQNYVFSE